MKTDINTIRVLSMSKHTNNKANANRMPEHNHNQNQRKQNRHHTHDDIAWHVGMHERHAEMQKLLLLRLSSSIVTAPFASQERVVALQLWPVKVSTKSWHQ